MELKLEVVVVPVSDVNRAKAFYTERLGFVCDHDHVGETVRVVQLTPPGSACSIVIGTGLAPMEPGCIKGLQLVAEDIEAVRAELAGRGVDVGDVQLLGSEDNPGSKFLFLADPDGNGWAIQELRRGGGAA